jgi:hypothetical protein
VSETHLGWAQRFALCMLLLACGVTFAACRTRATRGTIELEEYAVYRAALGAESYAIETRAPKVSPCKQAEARAEACGVSAELVNALEAANQRRGSLRCDGLHIAYERCVRWREIDRPMFHAFPLVVVSRVGFSGDGASALFLRTTYTSPQHGFRSWVYASRAGTDWRVDRQQMIQRF